VLGFFLVQPACAAAPAAPSPASLDVGERIKRRESEKRIAELFAARSSGSGEGDYQIGAGDELVVHVLGVEALNGTYTVARDGTILLPLVEEVRAAGVTEERLADVIAQRLGERYLQSPTVNVAVAKFRGRRVAVLGAVMKPGFYAVEDPGATIMDLINRAGGLVNATATWLYLSPASGSNENGSLLVEAPPLNDPVEIDLSGLSEGKLPRALELPVRSGDALYVEDAGQVVVEGWVRLPKPVRLRPGLSLVQAITDAGGLHFGASPGSVVVSRRGRGGPGQTLKFDYAELAAGAKPDVRLRAGDRVHVGANPLKASAWAFYSFVDAVVNVAVGGRVGLF
jgi:polysaccharide biosynthesis/export protein